MKHDYELLELEPIQADPDCDAQSDSGRMRVTVVYTTIAGTMAALETAARLARNLHAEIVLVVAEVVYFRYPLEHPPVSANFFERVCLALVDELNLDSCAARIDIHFCRDQVECLRCALRPRSLVVVGAEKGWLRLRERRLERALKQIGHSVVLVYSHTKSRKAGAESVARLLADVTARSSH